MMWSFFGGAEPGRVHTDVNGVTVDAGATWGPLQANGQSCAMTSGTSPWLHGAVDPELGMFYVTFGNVRSCGSSQDGQQRPGDNLFGNSIVALDMKTGAYKWHHQSVRHDIFDMDNVHSPVLADVQVGGQTRKAIYYGSKAHMTFILDRTNGKPLTGALVMKPMVVDTRQNNAPTQPFPAHGTWVDTLGPGPDECIVWEKLGTNNIPGNPWRGVPNYNGYQPDANGNLVYTEPNYLDVDKPFVQYPAGYNPRGEAGPVHRQGCLWEPHFDFPVLTMASQNGGADLSNHGYSPRTNLYYVPYGVAPVAHYRSAGSNGLRALGEYQTGGVFAINASTGKLVWQNHLGLDAAHGQGVLITAGDLLFVGQPDGMLYGLDADQRQDAVEVPDRWRHRGRRHDLLDQRPAVRPGDLAGRQAVGVQARRHLQVRVGQQRDADAGAVRRSSRRRRCRRRRQHGEQHRVPRPSEPDGCGGFGRQHRDRRHEPDLHARAGGHHGDVHEPGGRANAELPEPEDALRDPVLRGPLQSEAAPGQSFQYTFSKEGEYFFNDCTDPRPTGKVVAYHVPQDVPGALQFVPSILNMRPANGVFTSVQGLVTAMFKVPAGYTLDGNVQLKTPLSTTLFPAVTTNVTSDGGTLIATFDKSLIDNNMPDGLPSRWS